MGDVQAEEEAVEGSVRVVEEVVAQQRGVGAVEPVVHTKTDQRAEFSYHGAYGGRRNDHVEFFQLEGLPDQRLTSGGANDLERHDRDPTLEAPRQFQCPCSSKSNSRTNHSLGDWLHGIEFRKLG